MKIPWMIFCLGLMLTACGGSSGSQAPANPGGAGNEKGSVDEWQASLLGQEGHGGDALVCFTIPVERALYKVSYGKPEDECTPPGPCVGHSTDPNDPKRSGVVWRMTEEGRKSIKSAKPLEQYLAENITSKKALIDELNGMSVDLGYQQVLAPFKKLPAPFNRISETHKKLGWLKEDGISSEYGLMDVNDSGFINENEIDRTHCKELQAVVRRDTQLWYDSDIISHFDNAGLVLIQLHEEIYAWGKQQDQINRGLFGPPAHETSVKTRRLILKILDDGIDEKLVNENLKVLGFSTMYWANGFNVPTPIGYYMDTEACVSEQQYLKNFFSGGGNGQDFWLRVDRLFSNRYLKTDHDSPSPVMRNNFPDALANMIALTYSSDSRTIQAEMNRLQAIFERPESCVGSFNQ